MFPFRRERSKSSTCTWCYTARERNLGATVSRGREKRGISNNAMLALLERMDRGDITVHGFRSTFKDWVSECTSFPNHVSEAALWHAVADKVEAAYRRGDLLKKRTALMTAWGAYCASGTTGAAVVPLSKRAVAS